MDPETEREPWLLTLAGLAPIPLVACAAESLCSERAAVIGKASAFGLLAVLAACSQDADMTGSVASCANKLYSPFNPKNLDECVNVCLSCERGTMITCSTSCRLKGAR